MFRFDRVFRSVFRSGCKAAAAVDDVRVVRRSRDTTTILVELGEAVIIDFHLEFTIDYASRSVRYSARNDKGKVQCPGGMVGQFVGA